VKYDPLGWRALADTLRVEVLMRALVVSSFDSPEDIAVVDTTDPDPDGKVIIEVLAAGLGFPDALIAQGRYQVRPSLPFVPGMEVSGVVRDAPPGFSPLIGQRVTALTGIGGGCAEVVSAPTQFVYPAPANQRAWESGALIVNYHTAYFSLARRGQLREGETVLVHGAGGGLGQATVQVAKALGARVVAVASTVQRQRAAASAGADHVIVGDDGWLARLRDIMGGTGIDVVVDPVGGTKFTDSLRSLAPEGRLIVVGFASSGIPQVKVNRLLLNNISVVGAAWREFVDQRPEYGQHMATTLNEMFDNGLLAAPRTVSVPLAESPNALRTIIGNKSVGRFTVRMS
jgi:NADPH2:quinone reductase